jgi:hypothetical protein
MPKKPVLILVVLAFTSVFAVSILGQTSRKSVTAAEVTGTFRHNFTGKFRGNSNEIRILSIGKGKLKVAFDLIYPYYNGREIMANTGQADGTAEISGDTAVYSSNEFGPCRITIKFVKPGSIKVIQNGLDTDCGFGHNVAADGVYKKISSAKPKFRFD